MTQITAEMVRDLRERTGVGMMECKKALVAANGEMEQAIEALRKSGQAKAVNKSSRIAAEGLVVAVAAADNKVAVIGEVNCETDFVAREDRFKQFSADVVNCALKINSDEVTSLLQQNLDGKSVETTRLDLIAQLGENVAVRRIKRITAPESGIAVVYLHGGDGVAARIGVAVALDTPNKELAKDLAMHIAAMRPEYLREADIPAERLAKESEILLAQTQETNVGKPADILEKIVAGKISKFVKEVTLLGQAFVKNPDQTVDALLKTNKTNITAYARFEVGEGIEKKSTDFVSEVMSQAKG